MKAACIRQFGGHDVLFIRDQPVDEPHGNQVRIRITSAGLNRADCLYREGKHYVRPTTFPARIGYEAAGIVEAVGPDATWRIGDRVGVLPCCFDITTQGCFAESLVISSDLLLPTPHNISDQHAGAIWMAYLTACGALMGEASIRPDDYVVITAASSSVGLAAIAVAKSLGARIIATTTSEHKRANLLACGADHVINTKEKNYLEALRSIIGSHKISVCFDAVSGPMVNDHIRASDVGGTIIVYGLLDPTPWTPHIGLMIGKSTRLIAFNVQCLATRRDLLATITPYITERLNNGTFPLHIDRTFSLEQLADAQTYMESNQQSGKIVILPA